MNPPVFLGLGSNLGDRKAAIDEALRRLAARGFTSTAKSSLWLTEPVGGPPQGPFLNAVVGGETQLEPEALLATCLAIELELGRARGTKNGPRTIDLDLLIHGTLRLERPGLVVPHPRLHERRFVLAPLAEIAPLLVHPLLGRSVLELLDACPDRSAVRRLTPAEALACAEVRG
jgi:2-amino-4-hydroxy-6-hydroxymethyldihydropteridine diphosphokinase